jgi:SAM-dependent methyltransferase
MTDSLDAISSQTWQPGYLARHQEQQTYLRATSATSLLQQVAAKSMELLALRPGQRVLEVGCGNGVFLPRLAAAVGSSGHVVGVDHAEVVISEVRSRLKAAELESVRVEQADATSLPFADGTFEAAHCERMMMHLRDPDAALGEMVRVVRPGGVVVAAEPDWEGVRIDHPDPEALKLILRTALTMRHPNMGITLNRRMGNLGLIERRSSPVLGIVGDLAVWRNYGLKLETAVEALVFEGLIPAARLENALRTLESSSAAGHLYSVVVVHVVSGRVPLRSLSSETAR